MGGWVTVHTAAHDHRLRGAVLISAADMAVLGDHPRAQVASHMADDMESLEQMADEMIAHKDAWRFGTAYDGLASVPMLVITSNDGLAPMNDALVAAVRARGNKNVTTLHLATDHSYSDQRIALESAVIRWLQNMAR